MSRTFPTRRRGVLVKATNHQRGKSRTKRDKKRKALPPGLRRSRNGKLYYEARKNRTDLHGLI